MNMKTIMIVDDDQQLVIGLTARLRSSGYIVTSAPDAITAIATARKEPPDLMVLDLGLPGGDGFTVMDRMRDLAELWGVPVIVLSARDPVSNKQRALNSNAVAYFQKPPDNRAFLHAVRSALGESAAASTFLAS